MFLACLALLPQRRLLSRGPVMMTVQKHEGVDLESVAIETLDEELITQGTP